MGLDFLPPPSTEEYRVLTQDEIEKCVRPDFEEAGCDLPDPSVSVFVGCVKSGEVVGYVCLQVKLHAEPVKIKDGHSQIFERLIRAAETVIITRTGAQWVYVFTPAGRISQLAQAMGMQLEPWCVMSKFVTPAVPAQPVVELPFVKPEAEVVQ